MASLFFSVGVGWFGGVGFSMVSGCRSPTRIAGGHASGRQRWVIMETQTERIGEKVRHQTTSQTMQKRLHTRRLGGVGGGVGGLHFFYIGAGVCGCRLLFQTKFQAFDGSNREVPPSPKALSSCGLGGFFASWNRQVFYSSGRWCDEL